MDSRHVLIDDDLFDSNGTYLGKVDREGNLEPEQADHTMKMLFLATRHRGASDEESAWKKVKGQYGRAILKAQEEKTAVWNDELITRIKSRTTRKLNPEKWEAAVAYTQHFQHDDIKAILLAVKDIDLEKIPVAFQSLFEGVIDETQSASWVETDRVRRQAPEVKQ